MQREEFTLKSINGLSSRASASLVNEANKYESNIRLEYSSEEVDLKSIMNVMALVIRNQETFSLVVDGKDEHAALIGLKNVLKDMKLV